jgi:hypothetical protein
MNDIVIQNEMRLKIEAMEVEMRKYEQLDCPVKHYFSEGVYAREIAIPKGAIITGKIHKYSQLNILSKGDISVLTENGVVRVQAPFTIVSPPGTKRIAYAHEECVWTTVHGTNETALEKIEGHFIAQSNQEYLEFCKQIEDKSCLGQQ